MMAETYASLWSQRGRASLQGFHRGTERHMTSEEIARCLRLILDASIGLPLGDVAEVEGLIEAGERAVAFENVCTQLYEYEIKLPSDLRETVISTGKKLGVAPRYWERLDFGG